MLAAWLLVLAGALVADPDGADAAASAEQSGGIEAMERRVAELLAGGRWKTALEEARRLDASRPGEPRLVTKLGEALYRAGLLEEAEPVLEAASAAPSPPARALLTLGRLRSAQGRQSEAIERMRVAVAAAPEDRELLYWAADATATRGEAVDLLRRYLTRSAGDDPDRIEAARSSIAILAALGEREVWVAARRPERLELPLEPLGDPASGTIVGYVLRVRLDERGKPVPLLLDTGSPGLAVIERIARKHGFEPLAEATSFGGGGDRRQHTRRGLFEAVALGELRFTDALATAIHGEMEPTGRYHGLVGAASFGGYRITFDLAGRRLVLEPPGAEAEGAPYWTIAGQLVVRATLEPGGRSGLFLLDTGTTRSVVATSWAEELPGVRLGPPVEVHAVGGLVEGARTLEGARVVLAGRRCPPMALRAVDLSLRSKMGGVEIAGQLGLDVLSSSRIVVDTVHRTVKFVESD